MSDTIDETKIIVDELKEKFEATNQKLTTLAEGLNELAELETIFSEANLSLRDAASKLSHAAKEHARFIETANDLNLTLKETAETISKAVPEALEGVRSAVTELHKAQNHSFAQLESNSESIFDRLWKRK